MFAGHEALLNIPHLQVIHWQHVLLLLLLKEKKDQPSFPGFLTSTVLQVL